MQRSKHGRNGATMSALLLLSVISYLVAIGSSDPTKLKDVPGLMFVDKDGDMRAAPVTVTARVTKDERAQPTLFD